MNRDLTRRLLAFADDELILAHRNSEWTGHGPILEEDIALANLAQDELGHAIIWFGLVEREGGGDPDELAYFRGPEEFLNAALVELPRGDWAFTMLRQYLFDSYEALLLAELERSAHRPVAEAAAKMLREERFHLRHTRLWLDRLGRGTAESNARMQRALDQLWPYAGGLFAPLPGDASLVEAGVLPDLARLEAAWRSLVEPQLAAAGLRVPTGGGSAPERGSHTPHLATLLSDMQGVARADPEAVW